MIDYIIAQIAEQNGQSPATVRREMEVALGEAWATTDLPTKRRQMELFPGGKPTVDQFILAVAAGLL